MNIDRHVLASVLQAQLTNTVSEFLGLSLKGGTIPEHRHWLQPAF